MKKTWLIVGAVILVAAVAAAGVLLGQNSGLQNKIDELTAQVATLEQELAATKEEAAVAAMAALRGGADEDTLIIGYERFNSKFSPFYGESAYDMDVAEYFTGLRLMQLDRLGGTIFNGIEGETVPYNGIDYTYYGPADLKVEQQGDKTVYTVKLREDLVFSDGEPVTADDLIFTYYVLLDPAYVGAITLNSYDIVGLKAYQTQTPDDIYAKYEAIANAIYAAGADHEWAEGDTWTQAQQKAFWAGLKAAWVEDVQDIVNFVAANYNTDDYAPTVGATPAEIEASEGLQNAFGMAMWGFAEFKDGVLSSNGSSWTFANGEYPVIEDYYAATYAAYEGNPEAFYGVEAVDTAAKSTLATAVDAFISGQAKAEPEAAAGVPNIAGIQKLDDYTVQVTLNGFSAPAVYQVFGGEVTPLHYYGDKAQYDYAGNKFGHPFGDLSLIQAKTSVPLGGGPYKFVSFENKVVYLEANELYYKGAPKIKNIQLKETTDPDRIPGVVTGALDAANPAFSQNNISAIKEANGGELNGPVIQSVTVDNLGYGYVGVTATNVKVGDDPASQESKNLRKAFLTAIALYRDVACDSYYGEIANVINYPISNTSWAAPQKTDADYKVAFSTDIDGNDIYTADMNMEQKEAAAKTAVIGFLKAAGYTFDEAIGKFTAAPEGASLEYEVAFGTDGTGDHPSFSLMTDSKAFLEDIGITLTINDGSFDLLMDKTKSGNAQFFCMAWQATVDPDMHQTYHSSNVLGVGGTDSNHYMLADSELDKLIMDARTSADQAYRKAVYKAALDIIIDWAVELPFYQRQNANIFSAERLNLDTLPKDATTFYEYLQDIEKLEMK